MGDKSWLADFDVHFIPLPGAGHGEVGAAEEGDLSIHQNHLLVQDAVTAHEQYADAGLLQFAGKIVGGFAHAGAGAGAVFADDDHVEPLLCLLGQGGVEILDRARGASGNIVGTDPNGGMRVLDGIEDGLTERAGGEQADKTGISFNMAQRAADSKSAIDQGGIVVENISNGGLGDVLHRSAGGVVLEHVAAGLHHENPAGQAGAIAKGDFVGSGGGAKKKEHA